MAYQRCYTGPAVGPAASHVHPVHCGPEGVGYIPANPPASGPPGPLATGALTMTELFRSPLFIGAAALGAFVLWQSSKPKRKRSKRRNPMRRGVSVRTKDGHIVGFLSTLGYSNRDLRVYDAKGRKLSGDEKAQVLRERRGRARRARMRRKSR